MSDDIAIRLAGISKSYQSVPVLSDVTLSVLRHAIVAIRGVSGAGKTTLLNIIGGIERPDSGQVFLEQQDITNLPAANAAAFRRNHVGFVFQRPNLLTGLTALENIIVGLRVAGISGREAQSRAIESLDYVGLVDKQRRTPRELSVGQVQRIAIARALVLRPAVLLADEPTGNLDEGNKTTVMNLMLELRSVATVVIATHDASIGDRCDESFALASGMLTRIRP